MSPRQCRLLLPCEGVVSNALQVYEELQAENRFHDKLLEMYRWGKANGWDVAPAVPK